MKKEKFTEGDIKFNKVFGISGMIFCLLVLLAPIILQSEIGIQIFFLSPLLFPFFSVFVSFATDPEHESAGGA